MSTTPILQFGTSRFLQAHADLFISDALAQGQALGPITVVQSSGDAARARRLRALCAQGGFPVQVRGVRGGKLIDDVQTVTSVQRCLSTALDWAEITQIAIDDAQIILSNTSDAGFKPSSVDESDTFNQQMSYPAKLTHLLKARFEAGKPGLQVMPTELVAQNGDVLHARVLELATGLSAAFADWIEDQVIFVNSLVDRIVSEPLEPAGAVAEPYALWAIQDCPGLILPCTHPAVVVVPKLAPLETQKLYLLNLGHTYLVENWLKARGHHQFVRDLMTDGPIRADLLSMYKAEVLPAFENAGMGAAASEYVSDVLDRFANPFLDHRLEDIAQSHGQKIDRRIRAFLTWADSLGCAAPKPRLQAIAKSGGQTP